MGTQQLIYIYTEEDGIETMSNKNVVVVSVYHCALYQRVSVSTLWLWIKHKDKSPGTMVNIKWRRCNVETELLAVDEWREI